MEDFNFMLHSRGISVIQDVQTCFQNNEELMLFLSHLGDPRYAFTIYFPFMYHLHATVGKRVLWVAVISEWLNAVSKWVLHGERPFWWVHESGLYSNGQRVSQYSLTCETGPGSPSGHAMISSAVWYIMVSAGLHYAEITSLLARTAAWFLYLCVMASICVSRLFIATHFPHQVVAGVFVGVILGYALNEFSISDLRLKQHTAVAACLTAVAVVVYTGLLLTGGDPMWSVALAKRWCMLKEWIHADTSLFYSIVRDISSLIGLGFAVSYLPAPTPSRPLTKVLHLGLAVAVSHLMSGIHVPTHPASLFYPLAALKHFLMVLVIIALGLLKLGEAK